MMSAEATVDARSMTAVSPVQIQTQLPAKSTMSATTAKNILRPVMAVGVQRFIHTSAAWCSSW